MEKLKTILSRNPQLQITTRPNGTRSVKTTFSNKSKAHQAFRDKCNIKNILQGYQRTGVYSHINKNYKNPQFPNLSARADHQDTLNAIAQARSNFEKLPVKIRDKFKNNINLMLDFMSKPQNLEECHKLGLMTNEPLPQPINDQVDLVDKIDEKTKSDDNSSDKKTD